MKDIEADDEGSGVRGHDTGEVFVEEESVAESGTAGRTQRDRH